MNCPGLTSEDYWLYVLGLCEPSLADRIRRHLAEGCQGCTTEVRRGVVFWYQFTLVGAESSTAAPRPQVRSLVLERAMRIRSRQPQTAQWRWQHAVAAAVILVVFSALSWYFGDRGFLRRSQPAPAAVALPPPPVPPQEDTRALKERLDKAEQALAARGKITPPGSAGGSAAEVAALEQALAEARRAIAGAQQALGEQQTRATALEGELQARRDELAAAIRERQDAETRARSLAEDNSKAGEREQQIRTLTARVQELERENAEYRNVINRQRSDLEHSLQLATLLNSPSLRMIKLLPTEKGALAGGYAFVDSSQVLVYVSRLPDLPAGRTYQLWLIRGRAPAIVSGGLFAAGNQQRAIVEFRDRQIVSALTALAVTDEPSGGSPLPTGHKFLIGSVRPA